DEAQDLTPMQLRMLARRSAGPITILGDIAQAAGPVEYHRWDELLVHHAPDARVEIGELRLAYRVPPEVMELARPLPPLIAPDGRRLTERATSGRASCVTGRSTWSRPRCARPVTRPCARAAPG